MLKGDVLSSQDLFTNFRQTYILHILQYNTILCFTIQTGARGGVVVKILRYKPAGRGFDSRWCHRNLSAT